MDTELQAMSSAKQQLNTSIGIAKVKTEPDSELCAIFLNKYTLDIDRFDVSFYLISQFKNFDIIFMKENYGKLMMKK